MQARRDRMRLARRTAGSAALRGLSAYAPPLGTLMHRVTRLLPIRARAYLRRAPPSRQAPGERFRAIVIDHHWPTPDRDAGSIEIVNLARALGNLGFEVVIAASEAPAAPSPARDRLEAAGFACLRPEREGGLAAHLARQGRQYDLCVLCRVYCGGSFLETVQRHCGKARIVFNAIDLNFLREARRADLLADEKLRKLVPQMRAREQHLIRESDATLLVSEAELALTQAEIPEAFCLHMPLSRPLRPPVARFAERRGIGFIGGFAHTPNLDAVTYFLDEIWPLVLQLLPRAEFTIAGPDLPQALLKDRPGKVRYLGHLPEIEPWLDSLRLTIAPLRFGAGAKGKIASSLAAGLPAVVSRVAAEGMALEHGAGVLIADDAAEFAGCIQRLHEEAPLWEGLSAEALSYARRNLSLDSWQQRLAYMLRRLGF
jgi:glycosyltransferase involved in cell wall biosynthesis